MKNEKGITLVSLAITVIILIILASISVYSGTSTVRYAKYNKAKSEMEIMQANVNSWHQEYQNIEVKDEEITEGKTKEDIKQEKQNTFIEKYGVITTDSSCDQTALTKTVNATGITSSEYRFLSEDFIKNNLGLDASFDYLINIPSRTVILFNGLAYNGKTYYTAEDFGISNVKDDTSVKSLDLDLKVGEDKNIIINPTFKDNNDNKVNISKFYVLYRVRVEDENDDSGWIDVSDKVSKFTEDNVIKFKFQVDGLNNYDVKVTTIDKLIEDKSSISFIWGGENDVECPKFKKDSNLEIWHWYIYTPAQLKFLADFVNNDNALTDNMRTLVINEGYDPNTVTMSTTTMIYLMNDLDMGARAGTGSTEEEKWETESNKAREWTPIGTESSYVKDKLGTFDGKDHTIKGLYVNSTKSNNGHGLFGNSNTIQNLTIADSYVKGGLATGGIVGALRGGKIENCHNKNTTVILREGSYYIAGGVVGQLSSETNGINNCTNTGEIIGYGVYEFNNDYFQDIGGVVGLGGNSSTIEQCSNSGSVTGYNGGNYSGGIVGSINKDSKLQNCFNSGNVSGNDGVGGINGGKGSNTTIINSYSKGNVKGDGSRIGAIGGMYSNTGTYQNLYYLKSVGVKAVEGKDLESNNVKAIDNDFNSLNEFLTWLGNQ